MAWSGPVLLHKPRETVRAEVLCAVDTDRVELSLRELPRGWHDLDPALAEGSTVRGRVSRVQPFGVFVRLAAAAVTGMAHVSQLADDFVRDPSELFVPGQGGWPGDGSVRCHIHPTAQITCSAEDGMEASVAIKLLDCSNIVSGSGGFWSSMTGKDRQLGVCAIAHAAQGCRQDPSMLARPRCTQQAVGIFFSVELVFWLLVPGYHWHAVASEGLSLTGIATCLQY